MKKFILMVTCLTMQFAIAQAPNISYSHSSSYPLGTAITPLTPNNTGGAVTAGRTVSTFAGSGDASSTDGTGTAASFNAPVGMTVDANGNLYVSDYSGYKIRKITPAGVVTTFAGNGTSGSVDGTGTEAGFEVLSSLAADASGNIYLTDNNRIRKITPSGVVTTIAGNGSEGSANGTGTAASFSSPKGIAVDASGNLYVADTNNSKIRKITPSGVVTTFAGSGANGSKDGTGTAATFSEPFGIAVDASGNLYVFDYQNRKIRKITPSGVVTTLAGSGANGSTDGTGITATFDASGFGMAIDVSGNLYITEPASSKIRKITPAGVVTTLAGSGSFGAQNGSASSASFYFPYGVTVNASGDVFVADSLNNLIRLITTTGYQISPALPTGLSFNEDTGVISGTPTQSTSQTTYTITAKNSSGSNSTTVAFATQDTPTTPTFTQVAPICSGASLAALPTTSNNNIAGTWSPAVNNTATTTYTFTPTAGQNATTASMTITVNANVTPTFSDVAPICSVGNLSTLPTTSNNNITGLWSPSLNNIVTTTYTFTPTAGQCATTTTKTITVNPNVTPTFTQVAPICSGGNLAALPTTSNNNITGTWSPALKNTATTTYTFTPTAGQCAITTTMTIVVNSSVTPTFTQIAPICSGKRFIAALPSKSNNGITGVWSPALNNSATTTYTFTPNSGSCTATMTIVVNPIPAAPSSSNQSLCGGSIVANLAASGSNLKWYSSEKNEYPLASEAALTTANYYVTQTVDGCESAKTNVSVNITNAPTAYKTQVLGFGAKVSNLVASGTNLRWYDVAEGGTALASNSDLTTKTYYVSQTVNCESPRTAVAVSLVGKQFVDTNSTIANLFPSGDGITWYDVPKNGYSLASMTPLTTATYYFTQIIDGVESPRVAVEVVVNNAKIEDAQCGTTLVTTDTTIKANVPYPCKFEIKSLGFSTTFSADSNKFNFATITGIKNNTTYSVRVAPLVNGSYYAFGEACNITTSSESHKFSGD